MLVLHANWQPSETPEQQGVMFFWAESTEVNTKRRKLHPFAADNRLLSELIGAHNILLKPLAQRLELTLPTGDGTPQASPDLPLDLPPPTELKAWTVPGLTLSPTEALETLLTLEPRPGVLLGITWRYWQKAAQLGLEAITQHKLLPGLHGGFARWGVALDNPRDSARVGKLLQNMPPVCQAISPDPEAPLSPRLLLTSFLDNIADSFMRQHTQAPRLRLETSAENYLQALFENPKVIGSAAQLEAFSSAHHAWLRNLHVGGNERYRVAFRLEEPFEQGEDWFLGFFLQASDDPSLLVSAAQVWQGLPEALQGRFRGAHETLLAGLGYAARLYEPLKAGLKQATPEGISLDSDSAFLFLREVAPALEESGFGMLIPAWWTRPSARLGLKLNMRSSPTGGVAEGLVGLERLVDYDWGLSLGGESINKEEFEALVALKSPLVLVRGKWVRLDSEQVEAAVKFFKRREGATRVGLLEAMQMGLGGTEEVGGLSVEEVSFDDELNAWLKKLENPQKLEVLPQPERLEATLRPYQKVGVSWLAFMQNLGLGACLADDMGLGKTAQTLSLLLHYKNNNMLTRPVLLVCPTSVVSNWGREARRFTPDLRVMLHQGSARLKGEEFLERAKETDIVVTSFALARRDAETLGQVPWLGVVVDEAQNIKNPDTQASRVLSKMPSDFRIALTGTPVENRLLELWSIMNFLNPGYLGSRRAFRKNLALPIEREGDEEALKTLRRLTSPFILRRVKSDKSIISDLPEKRENRVYCPLSPEQASLYEVVVRDAMGEIEGSEGIKRSGLVLSMLTRLKQICNHPAQFLHEGIKGMQGEGRSMKVTRLVELLEETLSEGDKSLIFTQFTEMGEMLESYLPERLGVPVMYLHGGTPAEKRSEMVERFESAGGAPIFLLSLKAGGTGLNLTRATHVFHFDRWWNPAVEDQATDRAYRIGQRRDVLVHKFVSLGTLEERVDEMIEKKKALASSVVEAGEAWVSELSTEALRDLVSLREEALDE